MIIAFALLVFLTRKLFRLTAKWRAAVLEDETFNSSLEMAFVKVQLPNIPKAPYQRFFFHSTKPFLLSFCLGGNVRHVNFIYLDETIKHFNAWMV